MDAHYAIDFLDAVPQFVDTAVDWVRAERRHFYPQDHAGDALRIVQSCLNRAAIPLALVAQDGQDALGLVCLEANAAPPGYAQLSPWLTNLVVAPRLRGKGVEAALLARAASEARSLGCADLFVWTAGGKEWYRQQGWQLVGTTVFGQRYVVVMRLGLTA